MIKNIYSDPLEPLTVGDVAADNQKHVIRTYSGYYLNVFHPDLKDICIQDIAQGLSHVCRFAGQVKNFISVAQHSCLVTLSLIEQGRASKEIALAALLHDASEAYLGDMPSPIKAILPDYQKLEHRLMQAIALKYGFHYPLPKEVKDADKEMLWVEWKYAVVKSDDRYRAWSPEESRETFITIYNSLTTK